SHSCPSPSLHPTPTALYTLSLHDALPISSSATTPTPIGSSGASCACRRRSSNREHKPTRPLVPQIPDTPGALCPCPHSARGDARSEEHTSELQSRFDLVCRLLLEKKNKIS